MWEDKPITMEERCKSMLALDVGIADNPLTPPILHNTAVTISRTHTTQHKWSPAE